MSTEQPVSAELPVPPPTPSRHADFSRAVLDDLYRYPRKQLALAYLLWAVTGAAGGHRFYLDRPGTGLLMLFSGGGMLIWWIIDFFHLRKMVDAFNEEQARREASGLPPMELEFMPPRGATLPPAPAWVAKRKGRARLVGDVLVLGVAGMSVGAVASGSGNFEAVVAIVALCAITLLGARWDALAEIPVLRSLDRWSHRLRLFYYVTDPGGPLTLFFRPVVGLVSAPFRRKARAEAWLYLQVGAWFTIFFTGLDVIQASGIGSEEGFSFNVTPFFLDMMLTFVSIYAFCTPIGAILTTHVLLEKRDAVVWMLSAVALIATLLGIIAAA